MTLDTVVLCMLNTLGSTHEHMDNISPPHLFLSVFFLRRVRKYSLPLSETKYTYMFGYQKLTNLVRYVNMTLNSSVCVIVNCNMSRNLLHLVLFLLLPSNAVMWHM